MGQISNRLRSLTGRLTGRRPDEDAVARALRKQAAKAQRLEHKKASDKFFGPAGP
jgi:hypothetical protein